MSTHLEAAHLTGLALSVLLLLLLLSVADWWNVSGSWLSCEENIFKVTKELYLYLCLYPPCHELPFPDLCTSAKLAHSSDFSAFAPVDSPTSSFFYAFSSDHLRPDGDGGGGQVLGQPPQFLPLHLGRLVHPAGHPLHPLCARHPLQHPACQRAAAVAHFHRESDSTGSTVAEGYLIVTHY